MTRRRKTVAGVLGAAAAASLLFAALHLTGALHRLDLLAYDSFFALRGVRKGSERIVFVDVDDDAVRAFGRFPLARDKYRELIERLSRPESRALAVGFDIFLIERDREAQVDLGIGRAARGHGRVFFPAVFREPLSGGRARLSAELESRRRTVDDAYYILDADPAFRDRFRADPAGARAEFAGRGLDPAKIDALALKLLDERDVQNARSRVAAAVGGDRLRMREFLDGRMDREFGGVSAERLQWMKAVAQAEANVGVLWDQKYRAHLDGGGESGFLDFLGGVGIEYARLVGGNAALVREQEALLRARLAGRLGADAARFGDGVVSSYAGDPPGEYPVIPILDGIRELVGVQPYLTDGDGTVRSFPLAVAQGGRAYPSMGLAMALEALGARFADCRLADGCLVIPPAAGRAGLRVPVDGMGRMRVDWNGPWGSAFRHISLSRLLPPEEHGAAARAQAERLAGELGGRLVFVGLTAAGSHDLNPTPFEARYPMVGVNAHVADAILRGRFLRDAPGWAVPLLLVAGALAGALAGAALGRVLGPLAALAGLGAAFFGSFWSFTAAGVYLPPVGVLGALAAAYVGGLFWRHLVTEREGRKVKQVFAFRTSPELVEEMIRNPEVVRLGGKRVQATVFFADLAGFTAVAETTAPEDLIGLLNAYLSEVSAAIIAGGGYLDKYEGDAVMAIMGAPVERPDHAAAACRAALETQRRMEALRGRLAAQGRPVLRCRVGLASGEVVVGNIGSATRFDYTALGDNVNLASRLEGANKVYGTRILVSERTAELAGPEFRFREIDLVRVQGRRATSRVLELFGYERDLDAARRSALEDFARGLELYRARDFRAAADLLAEVDAQLGGADGPCETLIGRCQRFTLRPPPEDWGGVYEMTSK